MEAIASQIAAAGDATQYVTEADWIPDFWNFLLGLDRNDLIAELVQNDLDQEATQTVIAFEQDRVVCQGNGQPVDADGWLRLRKIRGAGDRVPTKRGKIGVKNHGLKTAFTIGDEVRVLSDGLGITQTLYAKGWGKAPYPGASPEPRPDSSAPKTGCRVEIAYRTRKLEPREGEAFVFDELALRISTTCSDQRVQAPLSSLPELYRRRSHHVTKLCFAIGSSVKQGSRFRAAVLRKLRRTFRYFAGSAR